MRNIPSSKIIIVLTAFTLAAAFQALANQPAPGPTAKTPDFIMYGEVQPPFIKPRPSSRREICFSCEELPINPDDVSQ